MAYEYDVFISYRRDPDPKEWTQKIFLPKFQSFLREELGKKDLKIFIYNGGIGLEEQLQPGINEMIMVLNKKGFAENKDLLFIKDTSAEHNESAWAKYVYRFLEFFFPRE